MTFADPLWLLALALVPAVWWTRRRAASAGRPDGDARGVAFPAADAAAGLEAAGWARLRGLPSALALAALALGIVALARPQRLDAQVARSAEGIDIVLALDVSTSMLAEDFAPNRFEAAKTVAAEFVRSRTSDRVGLVVFAGQAFTQAPLTLDYAFLLAMLREVQMGLIEDGTAIGTAIATAAARLRDSEARSRVVILLTDGQSNRGQIDPRTAAEAAAALGVRVYAIGLGTEGPPALDPFAQVDPFGRPAAPPSFDVDEATLEAVAEITGARYFRATDPEALREVYAEIARLERSTVEQTVLVDAEELYVWPLAPAAVFLVLALGLASTRLLEVP